MLTIRRGDARGRTLHEGLDGRHTFSFGEYYDPAFMAFGDLRVLNDDRVAPKAGFPTHGHRDMEIVTYVLKGALEHKDSMGNGSTLRPGEVQYMSAGRGVLHSEFNPSETEPLRLLQMWVAPASKGLEPRYAQKSFETELSSGELVLVVSRDGGGGSITIGQAARLFAARPPCGRRLLHRPSAGTVSWVQIARGAVEANGETLRDGDGAAWIGDAPLTLVALEDAEFVLWELDADRPSVRAFGR
jgi:quercetin 2,3-dioxygenase